MSKITRRLLLASTASIAIAGPAAKAGVFPRGGAQPGGGSGNLTVEITFPGGVPTGSTVVFDQSAGTDIGDYVAPTAGFTQHCKRSTNASIPYMFVDFRPDATGGRVEVVVWYGHVDPSGKTVATDFNAATLSKYTAVIKQNGVALKTYTIPFHYWGTRWRHQSAVRTVIRTPSQVFSQGWVPNITTHSARLTGYTGVIVPVDPSDVPTTNPVTGNPCWYPFDPPSDLVASGTLALAASAGDTSVTVSSPSANSVAISIQLVNGAWQTFFNANLGGPTVIALDKPLVENASNGATVNYHTFDCSLYIANDQGGDRGEEGIITEWQAEYLLKSTDPTRGPISLNNLIQQAEMMGSQWQSSYLPDLATNGPINYRTDQARWNTFTRVFGASDGGFSPTYYLVRGGPRNTVFNNNGNATEHGGNYFYLPYILTEDPYFLEALQYQHQLDKGFDIFSKDGSIGNAATDPTGASCICGIRGQWSYTAEPRDIGWGVRNTASSYACSLTSPPSWLLAQSAYGEAGYNQSKLINLRLTTSTNTFQTIYHNPCQVDYLQLFETSYFIMSLSLASKVGLVTTSPINGATSTPWSTHLNFFIQQFSDVCAPYTVSGGSPVSLTGGISGNVLTVSAISSGTLQVGQSLTGSGIQLNTWIMSQLTGTPGSTGTYTINSPQTIGSGTSMTATGAMGTTGWNIQACQITNIHYPAFDSTANPTNYYTSLGNAWTGPATPASAPTLTSVAAGSLGAATYFVTVTYVDSKDSFPANVTTVGQYGATGVAWGETTASPETSLAVAANHVVKVTSPPKVDGSGYYNVYISTATGTETLQTPWNTVGGVVNGPIPIGTDWTMPTSGLVTGSALPANSTTGLGEFFLFFPSNAPPLYVQPNSSTSNLAAMVAACGAAKSVSITGAASPFSYLNTMIDATYPNIDFTTSFVMRFGFDGT